MQNILQQQDDLKNFSQQQLIMEMQRPSGNVPQFLVLSELTRRKRMQEDLARAEAANAPTVAEEVVMAAGMGDMSQMAQAMAPKTSIAENTGIAAMMPRQPTRMATGGVVKMQTAGSPTREVVFEGKRYVTDGSGRVFEAARRGSMRRGREVTDPDIVSAVLATGPSVASDVGGLGNISTNLDTLNPMSEGMTPVQTPESMFTTGNQMPLVGPTDVQPNRFTDLPQQPLVKDKNFTLRPYEGPMSQSGVRGIGDVGGFNLDTLPSEKSDPITEVQTPDGVFTDGMFVGQNTAAERMPTSSDPADMSSVLKMIRGMPAMRDPAVIDPTTGQPYDALGLMRQQAEQARQADAQAAFDRSLPTPDELMVPFNNTPTSDPNALQVQKDPSTLEKRRGLRRSIFDLFSEKPDTSDSKKEDKVPDTTFLDNQPQTKEDIIEGETAAIINSAANTLANDVGGDALGVRGPEAAKAAQQGFDRRMWMRIAMFGLIASEGTAKSRSEAAKTFLAMDAKDKALETRERIAIGDRESREKVAGIRSKATQANTEARIKSATLNRDFRVLESIQDELKESLALITPIKGPVSAENKDAYDTLTQQLKEVREQIRNLGSFDLGPGSGQTEIAGSYNVTAGAS